MNENLVFNKIVFADCSLGEGPRGLGRSSGGAGRERGGIGEGDGHLR